MDQNIKFNVSAESGQAEQAFNRLKTQQSELTNETKKLNQVTGDSKVRMAALAYTIQDLPYGFRGISNTLPMLTNGLIKGSSALIGMNLAITSLTVLSMGFENVLAMWGFKVDEAGEKTKKSKGYIEDFIESHRSLESQLAKDIYQTESLSLTELRNLYKDINKEFAVFQRARSVEFSKSISGQRISPEAEKFLSAISKSDPNLSPEQQSLLSAQKNIDALAANIKSVIDGNIGLVRALGTDADLEAVQKRLEEFARTAPRYFKSALQVGKEEFKLTGQEADKLAEKIDNILNPKKKAKNGIENEIEKIFDSQKVKGVLAKSLSQEGIDQIKEMISKRRLRIPVEFYNAMNDKEVTSLGLRDKPVNAGDLDKLRREQEWLKSDFADSFGDALFVSGRDAFEKIFGEANSLLEIFLERFYTGMIGRGADAFSDTLFGFLSNNPVNFFDAFVSGKSSSQDINIYMDSELVAKRTVTSKNVNKAIKEMINLRVN